MGNLSKREVTLLREREKIEALLEEVGVPKAVTFAEAPSVQRTDLPARVEWALIACVSVTDKLKEESSHG
jgi:hypothetical protein